RGAEGLTLPELLISIVLVTIIIGVLSSAIIVGLRSLGGTHQRLSESRDAQMATQFVVTDVQSADTASKSDASCAGVPPLVSFGWTEDKGAPAAVVKTAAYFKRTANGEFQLVRRYCQAGNSPTEVVIAHGLCAGASCATYTASNLCPNGGHPPQNVVIALQETSGFTYKLA